MRDIKIGILTFQNGFRRGPSDFYPLIKWRREFKDEGIDFHFYKSHKERKLFENDVVIIDHRYYREITVVKSLYPNRRFIIELIQQLKEKEVKVILFDNADGTGSEQWNIIEYVDVFVKKQVLKDKNLYTRNLGEVSKRPFLTAYNLSQTEEQKDMKSSESYVSCPAEHLHKIRLGWNIGMLDYRYFPLSNYLPIGTSRLLNSVYKVTYFEKPGGEKPIDSAFRGKINKNNEKYSYQRNKVVDLFNKEKYSNFVTGDLISKNDYLKELRKSKICVSPFGWGEVCYRDFEAIMAGCLLIKPEMDHLETYPDVYKKNETYISLKWDMYDLEKTLQEALENYEDYKDLIINAQKIYKGAIIDSRRFIDHFKTLIN